MKITEVVVTAGRTFNHPFEQFSNLRPGITVKATLEEGETLEQVSKELRAKAESLVEDDKKNMLASLRKLHEMAMYQQRVTSLEDKIKEAQEDLESLRVKERLLSLSQCQPEDLP